MSDTYKTLHQSQLPAAAATLYTVPPGASVIIKLMTVVNMDGADRMFRLYRGGVGPGNAVTPNVTIPAGGSWEWNCTMSLGSNELLAGVASVAGKLTITVCGDLVTP